MEKRETIASLVSKPYSFHYIDGEAGYNTEYYVYLESEEGKEFYMMSVDTNVSEVSNIIVERVKLGVNYNGDDALLWYNHFNGKWDTYLDGPDYDDFMFHYNNYFADKVIEEALNEQ